MKEGRLALLAAALPTQIAYLEETCSFMKFYQGIRALARHERLQIPNLGFHGVNCGNKSLQSRHWVAAS